MERFCEGDEAAFDALYGRHVGPVYGFLLRLVRDPARAEDLTQVTSCRWSARAAGTSPGAGSRPGSTPSR
ncbi:MAG: sigma factor [Myxococcales bacterium]